MRFLLMAGFGFLLAVSAQGKNFPGDSIYQLESQWTDQSGQNLKMIDLAGAPRLVVMLFTRCQTTCPLVVEEVREILKGVPESKMKNMKITMFSFDSEQETSETLSAFAKKRKLDDRWHLLTGDAEGVAELAAVLGVRYKKIKDEYVHSNILFLVDENGVVKGKKEGLKSPNEDFISLLKRTL